MRAVKANLDTPLKEGGKSGVCFYASGAEEGEWREWPGALLARRTRTIKLCSSNSRSRGQPWPLPQYKFSELKVLARAKGTSRRAVGWAGEKVERSGRSVSFHP
jgi:hypothetical protein